MNQEQHHKKKTFREEYLEFVNRFNIDDDERDILKDIEQYIVPTGLVYILVKIL